MAITLDVITKVVEGSLRDSSTTVEKHFNRAGEQAGTGFSKSFSKSITNSTEMQKAFDKAADAAGKLRVEQQKLNELQEKGTGGAKLIAQQERLAKVTRETERAVRDTAATFQQADRAAGSMLSTLSNITAGTRLGGLTAQASSLASSLSGVGLATGVAIGGVTALAVGAVAAGAKLYDMGKMWDDISDNITAKTGKVGDELKAVTDQVAAVSTTTAATQEELGGIAAQAVASLRLSGDQLGAMIKQIAELNKLTGEETNTRGLGMIFRMFKVNAQDQPAFLDQLYAAFQKTGVPVNELIATLDKGGTVLSGFGMSATQAAATIGLFEEAGVPADQALRGLTAAFKNLNNAGKDPAQGLREMVMQIKALHDAGNDLGTGGARDLAEQYFGKGFGPILQSIIDGRLEIDKIPTSLENVKGGIDKATTATEDFAEHWQKFKNQLSTDLKPASETFFSFLNAQLDSALDLTNKFSKAWEDWAHGDWWKDSGLGKILSSLGFGPQEGQTAGGGGGSWGDANSAVSGALMPQQKPGAPGTSPNGFQLNAPEQSFSVNGVTAQGAAGGPGDRLKDFAQWFNDNIEPVKQLAGFDAGGHGLGDKSNHTSGSALDINWDDFTALQGNGANATTHFSSDQMARINAELQKRGLTWGQYWTPDSRDPGHYEIAGAPYAPLTGKPSVGPSTPHSTRDPQGSSNLDSNGMTVPMPGAPVGPGSVPPVSPSTADFPSPDQVGPASGVTTPVQMVPSPFGPQYAPVPQGSTPGYNQQGAAGTYLPDPERVKSSTRRYQDSLDRINDANEAIRQAKENQVAVENDITADSKKRADAAKAVAQEEKRLNQLIEDAQVAEDELAQAKRGTFREAQKAQKEKAKAASGGMDNLADDFGLSEGLPGLVKWFTTFAMNMAAAPMMGQLQATAAASPYQGGYGALGVMGAQNMSAGLTPLGLSSGASFMPAFTPGASAIGPAALGGGVGPGAVGGGVGPATVPGLTPPVGPGVTAPAPGSAVQSVPQAAGGGGGGGFQGLGGMPLEGAMMAAQGLDALAPGAGQAAQTGMKLANRAIGYAGQVAGIGVSGLMETLLPHGSALGDPGKSWLGRIAGGIAGARPALPNQAGGDQNPAGQSQPPQSPEEAQALAAQNGGGQSNGPMVNIENMVNQTPDGGQEIANQLARTQASAYATGGPR